MPLFRSKAEDKVRQAGYDPARLPPGQYFTEKWPVLHAGEVPDVDLATWTLEVTGEVEEPLTLTFEQLQELPGTAVTTDIHCVTAGAASTRASKECIGMSSRSCAGQ